jgi:hypothetical protein
MDRDSTLIKHYEMQLSYIESIHKLKDQMLCIVDSSQYSEVMASIVLLGIYEVSGIKLIMGCM